MLQASRALPCSTSHQHKGPPGLTVHLSTQQPNCPVNTTSTSCCTYACPNSTCQQQHNMSLSFSWGPTSSQEPVQHNQQRHACMPCRKPTQTCKTAALPLPWLALVHRATRIRQYSWREIHPQPHPQTTQGSPVKTTPQGFATKRHVKPSTPPCSHPCSNPLLLPHGAMAGSPT